MSAKVEEAAWLIRTMTAAELLELKATLGDEWLPPPDIGVREPRNPTPSGGHGYGSRRGDDPFEGQGTIA